MVGTTSDARRLCALAKHLSTHDLDGTALTVSLVSVLRVSVCRTYGDGNQKGFAAFLRWADTIGATTVTRTQAHREYVATGQLTDGTPVQVASDGPTRRRDAVDPVTIPLDRLTAELAPTGGQA